MIAVQRQSSIDKILEQDKTRDDVLCQWLREQLQNRYPDIGTVCVNAHKVIRIHGLVAAADTYGNDYGCDFMVTFPGLEIRASKGQPLPRAVPHGWQYGWKVDAKDSSLERRGRSRYWEKGKPQFAAEILSAFNPDWAPYINGAFVESKTDYGRLWFDATSRNGQRDRHRIGWLLDTNKITTHLLYIYRKDDIESVGVNGAWLFPRQWLQNAIVSGVCRGWYQDHRRMMLVNNYQPNTSNTKSLVVYAAADDLYETQSRIYGEIKKQDPDMSNDSRVYREWKATQTYSNDATEYVARFQLDPSSYYDRLVINGRQLP